MADSNAFCGIGKYDNGSEDETDIRPGPPSCFRHVPDRENPFHPVIRCHISEPQNPLKPAIWKLQEAESQFGKLVENALVRGPQYVTREGIEAVVVISVRKYEDI